MVLYVWVFDIYIIVIDLRCVIKEFICIVGYWRVYEKNILNYMFIWYIENFFIIVREKVLCFRFNLYDVRM